jgi:hypothetical protein
MPAAAQPVDATCGPAAFVKPPRLTADQLRQDAVLYVHVSQATFDAVRAANTTTNDTGGGLAAEAVAEAVAGVVAGVARVEGIGPVTDRQAQEFLRHCNVQATRVVDVAGQAPVDGYEVPQRITEALQLRHPTTVEPYSPASARDADSDHTERYVPRDQGGPPGQTAIDNLGRLTRFGHRVKTHAPGWQHHQPSPGVYLWGTPHGYWFRVDNTGTHHLGKNPDLTAYRLPEPKARPPQLAPT